MVNVIRRKGLRGNTASKGGRVLERALDCVIFIPES